MSIESEHVTRTIGPEVTLAEEGPMVRQERWEELRRLWQQERVPIAELAWRFELDRKTVRRCLRDPAWRPYQRPAPTETLLTQHAEHLRTRAPKVRYSAQILFQELRQQGYRGSYETVKRFVRPPADRLAAGRGTVTRFETPRGAQSQTGGRRRCASVSRGGDRSPPCVRGGHRWRRALGGGDGGPTPRVRRQKIHQAEGLRGLFVLPFAHRRTFLRAGQEPVACRVSGNRAHHVRQV
jgi:hypothetical protein